MSMPPNKSAKSNSDRFRWVYALLREPLSGPFTLAVKITGVRAGLHFNGETGLCNPGGPRLAKGTALGERTTERAMRVLRELGWIAVDRAGGGRGNSNSYLLLMDRVGENQEETPSRETGIIGKSPARQSQNPVQLDAKPRPTNRTNMKNTKENILLVDGDVIGSSTSSEAARTFDEWWKLYPRRVGQSAARKAFIAITCDGRVSIEELKRGAELYASERNGKDPTFTKHPKNWLEGECWQDYAGRQSPVKQELELKEGESPQWRAVRLHLCGALDAAKVNSWLGKLSFVAIDGAGTVLLTAPSKFIRNHVENNFHNQLLTGWRTVVPSVREIKIKLEEASPRAKAAGG